MQYGHFDDAHKEYIIDQPDTPRPWSNYLGSTTYGSIITNHAGGYSFYRSGAQGRFLRMRFNSVPLDQPGRYFYLHDHETKDYWSASWQPVGKDLKSYQSTCRHGTGYTIIDSKYAGISTEATYFVPLDKNFECWILKVKNDSNKPRKLSTFSFCEFASNWSTTQDLVNLQFTIFCAQAKVTDNLMSVGFLQNLPEDPEHFTNNDQGRSVFLGIVGAPVAGHDTDREAFLGPYRSFHNPTVVENGACTGSIAYGDNACGTFQVKLDLAPGETKEFMVVLGVGKADPVGKKALKEFDTVAKAYTALEELKSYWHKRLGSLIVKTPDHEFDSMVNVWNAYNAQITFTWSRAASLIYNGERDGLGYRDSVQDILGVAASVPEMARERLELLLTGQVSNGGAMPVVKPFAHNPGHEPLPPLEEYRSDDCLWLFNAVPEYVKETGDLAFFDKVLPYADSGKATVFGHLRRALEFNLERMGKHGLPCGLVADWNDCLKFGYHGESVFVTFQLRYGLSVYAEVARRLKKADEAEWAEGQLKTLESNIQKHTWDGKWFVRGFREDGSKLGSESELEGKIFLEPQVWSIISGAATKDQAATAMKSLGELLATEYGVKICTPPFEKTPHHVVRAVLINSGIKENGGIFSHTQGWVVMAEALLGHGEKAYQYYRAYMPAAYNSRAEIRQVEPYVHCQSTYSLKGFKQGASRVPWLSGTASWSYFAATHAILGIQPEYDGLSINPCLPKDWTTITVFRRFRGKDINITITKSKGTEAGVKKVTLNGKEIPGHLLLASDLKEKNEVKVELA